MVCVGSPFTVKVNGPADPSKVRVSGPGIHNGVLQEYDGSFTVNTQGAGPGELTVKIRGPKGISFVIRCQCASDSSLAPDCCSRYQVFVCMYVCDIHRMTVT